MSQMVYRSTCRRAAKMQKRWLPSHGLTRTQRQMDASTACALNLRWQNGRQATGLVFRAAGKPPVEKIAKKGTDQILRKQLDPSPGVRQDTVVGNTSNSSMH